LLRPLQPGPLRVRAKYLTSKEVSYMLAGERLAPESYMKALGRLFPKP
jgi:hypothetical protein